MINSIGKRRIRKLKAEWRDTWLLLGRFSTPLLIFLLTICIGGVGYYLLSANAGEPLGNLLEGIYQVLTMTFLQTGGNFPHTWYLGVFYFIMPVIGLIILAQGVTEFSVMLFNRRARGKEWEIAVASTYNNHIILVGLGHLGFRVAQEIINMDQDIVLIEANPKADLIASIKAMDIPVIQDDASHPTTLEQAGVKHSRAIILCTQNDSLNLKIALNAKRINPEIHVVLRIFDDDFAHALHEQFGFTAFSATGMAAPAFAAAASGVDMTRPITVEGQSMSLAHLKIEPGSQLIDQSVNNVEQKYDISVVFIRRNNSSDFHPPADCCFSAHDVLAVLGGPNEIRKLAGDNHLR
ncbi:MAG TPA: NAD-binding protein [Anaerolineales bacterium]|nr:NAD-binding protein [Anaerolineales bacterium]